MRSLHVQGSIRFPKVGFLAVLLAFIIQMFAVPVVMSGPTQAVKLTVAADGSEWEWSSSQATVGDILSEAGISLGVKDRVSPSLEAKALQGMKITVTRIEERIVTQREPIKFRTVAEYDAAATGRRISQEGQNGEKDVKYVVTYKDGVKVANKPVSSSIVKQPINQIVIISHPNQLASRGGVPFRRIRMVATAYAPFHCGGSRSGHAAMGMMATKGVVAVDPRVISLGTKVYVEGYGFAIAGDTGGAIKGARIDLCYDTYAEAIRYGRKKATVWVLD